MPQGRWTLPACTLTCCVNAKPPARTLTVVVPALKPHSSPERVSLTTWSLAGSMYGLRRLVEYAFAAVLLVSSMFLSFAGWAAKRPLRRYGVQP